MGCGRVSAQLGFLGCLVVGIVGLFVSLRILDLVGSGPGPVLGPSYPVSSTNSSFFDSNSVLVSQVALIHDLQYKVLLPCAAFVSLFSMLLGICIGRAMEHREDLVNSLEAGEFSRSGRSLSSVAERPLLLVTDKPGLDQGYGTMSSKQCLKSYDDWLADAGRGGYWNRSVKQSESRSCPACRDCFGEDDPLLDSDMPLLTDEEYLMNGAVADLK